MISKWHSSVCAFFILLGPQLVVAVAADVPETTPQAVPSPSIFHPTPKKRIHLADYEDFSMIEREMQNVIAHHGNPSQLNQFCAVGYALSDDVPIVFVIWHTKNTLYFWYGGDAEGAKENFKYATSLRFSPYTDLNSNVVEDDYAGALGTRILRRSELNGTLADCKKHGKQYTIPPFAPPQEDEG